MVDYSCLRCGYIASQKINLKHHLNRKNVCKPILEDISIEEIKFMYGFEINSKSLQNNSILTPNNSKMNFSHNSKITPNHSKLLKTHSILTPNNSKKEVIKQCCDYCLRTYIRKDNLTKHLKKCKIKIEKEKQESEKDKKIEELKEIVEKLLVENKGNTNILNSNNNSHNTTNNIININNYGDEDTKYITSNYILKLLKNRPAKTIPELIKYTHFNDAHPENQNIKITNKKEPYIKVRKNNKWELQDKDETITDLIDRQQIHLLDEDLEKKVEEVCSTSERVNIGRCSDLYNEEDRDYMKRLYNESELIIINNS